MNVTNRTAHFIEMNFTGDASINTPVQPGSIIVIKTESGDDTFQASHETTCSAIRLIEGSAESDTITEPQLPTIEENGEQRQLTVEEFEDMDPEQAERYKQELETHKVRTLFEAMDSPITSVINKLVLRRSIQGADIYDLVDLWTPILPKQPYAISRIHEDIVLPATYSKSPVRDAKLYVPR